MIVYDNLAGNKQSWTVYPVGIMNMYGVKIYYTLLLEKD